MMQIHAALYCFKIYQLLLTAYTMILLLLQLGNKDKNPTSCWPATMEAGKNAVKKIRIGCKTVKD